MDKRKFNTPYINGLVLKIHEIVSKNILEGDDAFCVGSHQGIALTKIQECLDEVINLTTNHPRFLHSLVRGILLHYFIAYIHPFFDGNGMTARTLF